MSRFRRGLVVAILAAIVHSLLNGGFLEWVTRRVSRHPNLGGPSWRATQWEDSMQRIARADKEAPTANWLFRAVSGLGHARETLDYPSGWGNTKHGINLADAGKELLQKHHLMLENGYLRLRDGSVMLAAYTPLPKCTAKHLDWWFAFCDTVEKFTWAHPEDHVFAQWSESGIPIRDRRPGWIFNKSLLLREFHSRDQGGNETSLQISFSSPSQYGVDDRALAAVGVGFWVFGRISIQHPAVGRVEIGHLSLQVRDGENGAELRTHIWLGQINLVSGYGPIVDIPANIIGNSWLLRTLLADEAAAARLLRHVKEEAACVAVSLPSLFLAENARGYFV